MTSIELTFEYMHFD